MFNSKINFAILITYSFTVASCSLFEAERPLPPPHGPSFTQSDSSSSPFQKAINRGRVVKYHVVTETKSPSLLRLTSDPKKVEVKEDTACQCIGWTRFNTDLQESVSAADLKAHALNYLRNNSSDFKVSPDDLTEAQRFLIHPNDHLTVMTFKRNFQDIPVEDAYVQFIYQKLPTGQYKLAEYVNRSFGEISINIPQNGTVTPQSIASISGLDNIEISDQTPVIYVKTDGNSYQFSHAVSVNFRTASEDIDYSVIVQSDNNAILEASNNRFEAQHTVKSNTYDKSYVFNDLQDFPMSFLSVNGNLTDIKGVIDTEDTSFNITLNGVARVFTANNLAAPISFTVPKGQNGVTVIDQNNAPLSGLNAFTSVARINEYVRQFLTPQQVPFLDQTINVIVDINDECNAFFDPNQNSINFFQASNNCGNTALINDVVYHEWGHALDNATGTNPGIPDGAFSEGIGDIVSVLLSKRPNVGPGFFINQVSPPVRNLDNNMRYDPTANLEVHVEGQVIGGSFWDFRQNMIATYGEEEGHRKSSDIFLKHLLTTDTYVDSFAAFLRLNDDDQNPGTRSPDECKIRQAFARHNLTQEDAGCIDDDAGIKVMIDEGSTASSISLQASAHGAKDILLCKGDVLVCTPTSDGYQLLAAEAKDTEDSRNKLFYKSTSATQLDISEGDVYTLFSTNIRNQVIGRKVLEFSRETED